MQNRVGVAWIALLSSALLSLAVAYGIATEFVVVGSRAGGWVFSYSPVSDPRCLTYALIAIAVAASLAIRRQ